MLIEAYFQEVEKIVANSYLVVASHLVTEKRSLYIGFIEGTLTFLGGSTLHFMEFVNVKSEVNRYKYAYHFQNSDEILIFRYDMAPHCPDVKTFPHHKHTADNQITDAPPPSLADILNEIERTLD